MTIRSNCRVDFSKSSNTDILNLASRLATLLPRRRPLGDQGLEPPTPPNANVRDRTADILPFKTKD